MENINEEIIQPLTDEELEIANGGVDDGFRPASNWNRCPACGLLTKNTSCPKCGKPTDKA